MLSLYPRFAGETGEREPTEDEAARYQQFEKEYVCTSELWM
jgi:hypothetical protein